MSRKPEAVYRDSVHRHLHQFDVHQQPIGNEYHTGTPDMFYSGPSGVLFIEWKIFLAKGFPLTYNFSEAHEKKQKPALSPRQAFWLHREAEWKREAWVLAAHKESGRCLAIPGLEVYDTHEIARLFTERCMTRVQTALWIKDKVGGRAYQN